MEVLVLDLEDTEKQGTLIQSTSCGGQEIKGTQKNINSP